MFNTEDIVSNLTTKKCIHYTVQSLVKYSYDMWVIASKQESNLNQLQVSTIAACHAIDSDDVELQGVELKFSTTIDT